MFKEVLNSEGVEQLSRQEMKSVDGGKSLSGSTFASYCRMVITFPNGVSESGGGLFTGSSWQAVSQAAGQECANAMAEMGASRCTYDCEYDGYGR
jgi:hypothetical protein